MPQISVKSQAYFLTVGSLSRELHCVCDELSQTCASLFNAFELRGRREPRTSIHTKETLSKLLKRHFFYYKYILVVAVKYILCYHESFKTKELH